MLKFFAEFNVLFPVLVFWIRDDTQIENRSDSSFRLPEASPVPKVGFVALVGALFEVCFGVVDRVEEGDGVGVSVLVEWGALV